MNSDKSKQQDLKSFIINHSTRLKLPRGQSIYFPGDIDKNIYYIEQGKIKFVIQSFEGDEKMLFSLKEGQVFNEDALIGTKEIDVHAFCDEDSVLLSIDCSMFNRLRARADFMELVLENCIYKQSILRKEVECISFLNCKDRILRVFVESCDTLNLIEGQWYCLNKKYTHQELAGIIGANRVTVSKLIMELCECGKIRTVNRKIQIHKKVINSLL